VHLELYGRPPCHGSADLAERSDPHSPHDIRPYEIHHARRLEPPARHLQAAGDALPFEHPDGVSEKGRARLVDDQRRVHQQIFAGEEELDNAFMGDAPSAADNVWLREAAERQVPLIYFLDVSPGRYQAIIPTFVVDWDPRRLTARIAFGELAGATATATAPDPAERRYALRLVKQRLH
jgi:hypothetical protein